MANLTGWNISALFYAKTYGPLAHQLDEDLFSFMGGSLRGALVADCGCGPGVVSQKLADHGAAKVLAIDVSPQMLQQVPRVPSIQTVQAVMEDGVLRRLYEAEGRGFDLILFKRSLYQDRPVALRILQEAYSCLRPNGCIVIIHPEGHLMRYAFGYPPRLERHSLFHLFNRTISIAATFIGIEKYALYSRAELVSLAGEVGGQVEEMASEQQAFNLVAIRRPSNA
jgi:SAM-dependent methyltransferase